MIPATLEQRVSALERQNRHLRSFAGALLILVCLPPFIAAVGQSSATPADVLRAGRFEVVRDGRVVVSIASDAEGGEVIVRNAAGLRAGYLKATKIGGSLDISDPAGKTVGYFDALKTGGGEVAVFSPQGGKAATLFGKLNGGGELTIYDAQERRAAYLRSGPYGGSLDISKFGETVGYFDGAAAGEGSVGAVLCVGKTPNGCHYRIPSRQ